MPYNRPTLQEIITRVEDSLKARLGGTAARRSVNSVLARVFAGTANEEYGAIDFISRQIIPNTSTGDYLDLWAAVFGIIRLEATFASGDVDFIGTGTETVTAGSLLVDGDGIQYAVDADIVLVAGAGSGAVTAVIAGTGGNLAAGQIVTLQTPIVGVTNDATVATAGITGGFDQETDEQLQERLVLILQTPPRGGAEVDYIYWAQLVNGVGRVFVFPFNGGQPGNVDLTFLTDDPDNQIPDAALIAQVQASIDLNRPVTVCSSTVFALQEQDIDFTISVTPDTTEVRTNVEEELKDLIARESSPGGTILLSHINEAISVAPGETDHTLISPIADATVAQGFIHAMGTITWV